MTILLNAIDETIKAVAPQGHFRWHTIPKYLFPIKLSFACETMTQDYSRLKFENTKTSLDVGMGEKAEKSVERTSSKKWLTLIGGGCIFIGGVLIGAYFNQPKVSEMTEEISK